MRRDRQAVRFQHLHIKLAVMRDFQNGRVGKKRRKRCLHVFKLQLHRRRFERQAAILRARAFVIERDVARNARRC